MRGGSKTMKGPRFHSRLPQGITRRQTILPAGGSHVRLTCGWAKCFNFVAGTVLVVLSSAVMARLITSEYGWALTFAPFYVFGLFLIGGFLFNGKHGKWITVKVTVQVIVLFVVLPICVILSTIHWINAPQEENQTYRQARTNDSWGIRTEFH
jgi:hypothetical protein